MSLKSSPRLRVDKCQFSHAGGLPRKAVGMAGHLGVLITVSMLEPLAPNKPTVSFRGNPGTPTAG